MMLPPVLQISEFLSGRCPLTVKLAVGAHIMYVQLQLSAKNVLALQKNQNLRAQSDAPTPAAPAATEMINPPKIYIPGPTTLSAYQTNVHSISSDSSFETKGRHRSPAATTTTMSTTHRISPVQDAQ